MSKLHKKIALPFIFVFALPILTVFCCCNGAIAAEKISSDHHHAEAEAHHGNHTDSDPSACHHSSKSSHNHSECNHPQLIANFVNNATPFFAAQISYLQKFPNGHFKELAFFQDSLKSEPSLLFLNTGPPVFDSSKTPLYLQLSVLRI